MPPTSDRLATETNGFVGLGTATRRFAAALACLALGGFAAEAAAQFSPQVRARQPSGDNLVQVDLIRTHAEPKAVADGSSGEPVTHEVAVVFRIENHWHVYWKNPGASGVATEIRVRGADGAIVGDVKWPVPRSFRGEEGITFGYEGGVALFVPITAPRAWWDEPRELTFAVDWLVCRGICLTGSARRTLQIGESSSDEASKATPAVLHRIIEASRGRIPSPLQTLDGAEARIDGSTLVVTGWVPDGAGDTMRYFPIDSPGVTVHGVSTQRDGRRFTLRADLEIRPENSLGKPLTVGGVLALDDDHAFEFLVTAES